MTKTFATATRHLAAVTKLEAGDPVLLEAVALGRTAIADYTDFWTVTVASRQFLVGRGYKGDVVHKKQRQQYVVWYPNGYFWISYGTTIPEAIDGAMRDAWLAQPST